MPLLLGIDPVQPTTRNPGYRRKGKSKIRKWTERCLFFSVLSVVGIFILSIFEFALESPDYAIRKVEVRGLESSTTPELFLEKAGLRLEGMNYFLISPRAIEKKLMSLPYVFDCKVEKKFPDTVIITVEEVFPFATVCIGSNLFLIDKYRRVVKRIYSVKDRIGPLITGLEKFSKVEEGDYLDDEGLFKAMEFWYEYELMFSDESESVKPKISEIVIENGGFKVFFDEIGCETRWKVDHLSLQVQKFYLAMKNLNLNIFDGCEYIDLRFGNEIVYK